MGVGLSSRSNMGVGLLSAFEWSTGDRYLAFPVSFFCHDWGTAVIEPETKRSQSCCGLVLGTTYTSRRF